MVTPRPRCVRLDLSVRRVLQALSGRKLSSKFRPQVCLPRSLRLTDICTSPVPTTVRRPYRSGLVHCPSETLRGRSADVHRYWALAPVWASLDVANLRMPVVTSQAIFGGFFAKAKMADQSDKDAVVASVRRLGELSGWYRKVKVTGTNKSP